MHIKVRYIVIYGETLLISISFIRSFNRFSRQRALYHTVGLFQSQWVRTCVQLGCTVNPRPFAPERPLIFAGMTFAMTQLVPLDLHRLWALAVAYGAKCERVLSKKTTHLICGCCTGVRSGCFCGFVLIFVWLS